MFREDLSKQYDEENPPVTYTEWLEVRITQLESKIKELEEKLEFEKLMDDDLK